MRWSVIWEGRKAWWSLTVVRNMGGGPRTFPGGVNKWKWKRMHENRARDKEKRLLDQEKQLYEARIRSHIRSTVSPPSSTTVAAATHGPISPHDHVKALANRFLKEGAEDLWNSDDGPLSLTPSPTPSPIDLRKLIPQPPNRNLTNYTQTRDYCSVPQVRNVAAHHHVGSNKRRFWRNDSSSGESESEGEIEAESYDSKIGSSASLGKYDLKREKRVIRKSYEEESDFKDQVELIKFQLNQRKLTQNEEHQSQEQQTILSQTRYLFGMREVLCLQ